MKSFKADQCGQLTLPAHNTKLSSNTHQCRTTVSLETYTLYSKLVSVMEQSDAVRISGLLSACEINACTFNEIALWKWIRLTSKIIMAYDFSQESAHSDSTSNYALCVGLCWSFWEN